MAQQNDIKYIAPVAVDIKKKKYCRFKKSGIKYISLKQLFKELLIAVIFGSCLFG